MLISRGRRTQARRRLGGLLSNRVSSQLPGEHMAKFVSWISVSSRHGRLTAGLAVAATLMATPAAAQHHARLSEDLADHLNAGSQSIDVIVHGDGAAVAALARRYNIRIKKALKEGAVLNVNAGQLDAIRRDETQDHISGDMRIRSSADANTEAIGADQVWRGSDEVGPLSGNGVSVAVIDSGIDTRHS